MRSVLRDSGIVVTCGRSFPLQVLIHGDTEAWEETAEILDDIFLGDAELRRRSFDPNANPRGGTTPVVTGEGDMLIDIQFYEELKLFGEQEPYETIVEEIELTEGVVSHGLIVGKTDMVFIATSKGPPIVIRRGEEIKLDQSEPFHTGGDAAA